MASKGIQLGLLLVLFMMLYHEAVAQSGCTMVLITLSPCLNYVTGNSSTPSSSCCSQLASIVQSQPQCLCQLVNGGSSSLGISINETLAMALPGACGVQTPPTSRCKNGGNTPATAPTPASSPESPPADSTDDTPSTLTTPSATSIPTGIEAGSGSKTVPMASGTSDASITRMQLQLTVVLAVIATFTSKFFRF